MARSYKSKNVSRSKLAKFDACPDCLCWKIKRWLRERRDNYKAYYQAEVRHAMIISERHVLQSEIAAVEEIIDRTPKKNVIDLMSWEHRKKELEEELSKLD